jgi:Zn finger protein HypA/HybF involved in hydrogenase expression
MPKLPPLIATCMRCRCSFLRRDHKQVLCNKCRGDMQRAETGRGEQLPIFGQEACDVRT